MFTAAIPGVTEVQAGGHFMDAKYRDEFHVEDLHLALRVVTTVTSHRPGQLVTDAGFKPYQHTTDRPSCYRMKASF